VMLLIKSRTEFYPFILKGKMLVHPNWNWNWWKKMIFINIGNGIGNWGA
jgi:hypothetical protein